jgi:hypothetical protein
MRPHNFVINLILELSISTENYREPFQYPSRHNQESTHGSCPGEKGHTRAPVRKEAAASVKRRWAPRDLVFD